MSLVADYGSSSESELSDHSDSNSSSNHSSTEYGTPINPTEKLPTPDFEGQQIRSIESDSAQSSVFANPFKEAENAKQAILEKHVKMVNTQDNTTTINGKRICWNFRKGKCRFGHNCVYAHDSDVQKTKEQLESEKQLKKLDPSYLLTADYQGTSEDPHNSRNKRKRPGLTQGIVPGKKVMKAYHKQKTKSVI